MVEKESKVILAVQKAKDNLNALICSFECRYKLALKQIKGGQQVVINVDELQKDLIDTRKAAAQLLGTISSLQNAIEDLNS